MSRNCTAIFSSVLVVAVCLGALLSIPQGRPRNAWISTVKDGLAVSHVAATTGDGILRIICSPGNCMGYIAHPKLCSSGATAVLLFSGGGSAAGADAVCRKLKIPEIGFETVVATFPFNNPLSWHFVRRKTRFVAVAFPAGHGRIEVISFPTKAFFKSYVDVLTVRTEDFSEMDDRNPLKYEGYAYNVTKRHSEPLSMGLVLDELTRIALRIDRRLEGD